MLTPSQTWINYNYVCVGVAYCMIATSLWLMPINLATKGYLGMAVIFLSGSLVNLVKTLYDMRIEGETAKKLERAKQDRLLEEFAVNS